MTQAATRVAIVGSGISGLSAAHHLRGHAEVTLFEAGDYFGGHTHTVRCHFACACNRCRLLKKHKPLVWTPAFWCSTNAPIQG